jgi:hypothetical protein
LRRAESEHGSESARSCCSRPRATGSSGSPTSPPHPTPARTGRLNPRADRIRRRPSRAARAIRARTRAPTRLRPIPAAWTRPRRPKTPALPMRPPRRTSSRRRPVPGRRATRAVWGMNATAGRAGTTAQRCLTWPEASPATAARATCPRPPVRPAGRIAPETDRRGAPSTFPAPRIAARAGRSARPRLPTARHRVRRSAA